MANTPQTSGSYNPGMIHMMASSSALTYGSMVSNLEMWAIIQVLMQQIDTEKMNSMATTGAAQQEATQSSGENEAQSQEWQGIQGLVSGGTGALSVGVGYKLSSSYSQESQQYLDKSQNNQVMLEAIKYLQKNPTNQLVADTRTAVTAEADSPANNMYQQLKTGIISGAQFDAKPEGLSSIFVDEKGNYIQNPATKNLAILDVLAGNTNVQINGRTVSIDDIFSAPTVDAQGQPIPNADKQNVLFRALAKFTDSSDPDNSNNLTKLNEKVTTQLQHNEKMYSNTRAEAGNQDQRIQQAQSALQSLSQGVASHMSSVYTIAKAMYDSINAMFNTVMQLTSAQSKTMQDNISQAQQMQAQTLQMMNSIASSQSPAA